MISLGFTGSRRLSEEAAYGVVTNVLYTAIPAQARTFVTGGCTGLDSFAGRWLWHWYPSARHLVIVPADRSRVDPWWEVPGRENVIIIEMPPDTSYLDRNKMIVANSGIVFGFPEYPEDEPRSERSGTWQTIRLAREAGVFSQWHCVLPPYQGRIECYPRDLISRRRIDELLPGTG